MVRFFLAVAPWQTVVVYERLPVFPDVMAHPNLTRSSAAAVGAVRAGATSLWLSAPALPAPRPAFIYALAAYVAVVVTRSHEVVPFLSLVRPAKLSLLIVVAALAANIHQLPWKELPKSSVTKFMFATAILAILSVPGAYWPGGSAKFLPTAYLQTFLVFVLVAAGFIH